MGQVNQYKYNVLWMIFQGCIYYLLRWDNYLEVENGLHPKMVLTIIQSLGTYSFVVQVHVYVFKMAVT